MAQHCKWIEKCLEVEWRVKVASLNILLTAVVWRQDHNGFTHQDPGFLDVVANKSPEVVRIYLPPDGNCLLSGKFGQTYLYVFLSGTNNTVRSNGPLLAFGQLCQRHCVR